MSSLKITVRGQAVLFIASVVAAAVIVPWLVRGFCGLCVALYNVITFI